MSRGSALLTVLEKLCIFACICVRVSIGTLLYEKCNICFPKKNLSVHVCLCKSDDASSVDTLLQLLRVLKGHAFSAFLLIIIFYFCMNVSEVLFLDISVL